MTRSRCNLVFDRKGKLQSLEVPRLYLMREEPLLQSAPASVAKPFFDGNQALCESALRTATDE